MLAPTSGARFLGGLVLLVFLELLEFLVFLVFLEFSSFSRASSPTAQPEPLRGERKWVRDPERKRVRDPERKRVVLSKSKCKKSLCFP